MRRSVTAWLRLGGGIFPLPLLSDGRPVHRLHCGGAWRGNIPPPFVERASAGAMACRDAAPWRGNIPPPFVERAASPPASQPGTELGGGIFPLPLLSAARPGHRHPQRRLGGGIFPLPLLSARRVEHLRPQRRPWRGNIPPPFVERTGPVSMSSAWTGSWRGNIPPPFVERSRPRGCCASGGTGLEGEYSPSLC